MERSLENPENEIEPRWGAILQEAVYYENKHLILDALKAGVNINQMFKTKCGNMTALHLAVRYGNFCIIRFLLQKGADPNVHSPIMLEIELETVDLITPLHYAIYLQKQMVVRELLQNGADPNIYTMCGYSPIHLAVLMNHEQILRYVCMKANINQCSQGVKYLGWTSLHLAIALEKKNMVEILLQFEADITKKCAKGFAPLHFIKSQEMFNTLLHYPLYKGKEQELAKFLFENNVNFNATAGPEYKSLFLLANEQNNTEFIQSMQQLGAKPENSVQWNLYSIEQMLNNTSLLS